MLAERGKLERNERLLRIALAERPDDAFLRWQLARTLWKRGGEAREVGHFALPSVVDGSR